MSPRQSGLFHLSIVYAVWGSTFLALGVASRAFSPLALSAMRVLAAALLLFAIALATRKRLAIDRRAFAVLSISGVTVWAAGHGALLYGAERADSGYVAVVFGTTPIWSLVFESLKHKTKPKAAVVFFTALGFGGIIVLTLPSLYANAIDAGAGLDPKTAIALLAAPIGWALGSTIAADDTQHLPAISVAAYQQLFGGLACACGALLFERGDLDRIATASSTAYLAWLYLVIPGCVPAFTSYVRALQLLPASRVMTFAYVNPMIAVVLGAWLLDESITFTTLAGMAILFTGVAGIQSAQGSATPESST